jgi:hypothetical protein
VETSALPVRLAAVVVRINAVKAAMPITTAAIRKEVQKDVEYLNNIST